MRSLPVGAMALAILIASAPLRAAVIYVDDSALKGLDDGTNWDNAFIRLQDALAIALAGDEIRIAQGTYRPADGPGDRTATFRLVSGAIMQGGYAGLNSDGDDPDALDPQKFLTLLTGDLAGDDGPNFANYGENSLHVVTASGTTEMRGVIVTGGSADNPQAQDQGVGAAVFIIDGTLALHQCVLQENVAYYGGAGVYCLNGNVHMGQCEVRGNENLSATAGGVGVAAGSGSTFSQCTFEQNVAVVASNAGALSGTNLTLTSCTFNDNFAGEDGAAIYGSTLSISDCAFIGNNSGYWGTIVLSGGQSQVVGCQFEKNSTGVEGGAIMIRQLAQVHVADCAFTGNLASFGGALKVDGTALIMNCTFDGNANDFHGYHGGAISVGGEADIINCIFRSNFAIDGGGAISNSGTLDAVNCVFSGNTTDGPGSAMLAYIGAKSTTLTNCTIVGNSAANAAAVSAGEGSLTVNNCILWDNDTNGLVDESTQLSFAAIPVKLNHNCVHGWTGALGGEDNFGNDPLFVDANGPDDDYGTEDDNPRLAGNSPCVDAGDADLLPADGADIDEDGDTAEAIPLDLDLENRVAGSEVDAGAFELQQCAADIAPAGGDGVVNTTDLQLVLISWSICSPGNCEADIAPPGGNGVVDVDDLLAVIHSWGTCP
jgi:predicted outer membrane repeat protein